MVSARDVPIGHVIPDPYTSTNSATVINKVVTPMVGAGNDLVTLTLRDNIGEWTADLYGYEEVTADSVT